jgi:hypothetical protein
MEKRYIVVANPTTAEQDKVFQAWVSSQGIAWWHWLNETWLLVDLYGKQSARGIRSKAIECFPGINLLVVELTPVSDTWAGFGPNNDTDPKRNMFNWIKQYWTRD